LTDPRTSFQPGRRSKIALANDGDLTITFLGVGAAFATEAFQSNILLVKGPNHLLIDLGTKGSLALRKAGLSVLDITNLLATHSHADHIGGIEEWLLKSRYVGPGIHGCGIGEYRPNLFTTREYADTLWDASLRGGLQHADETGMLTLEDYVEIRLATPLEGYGRPVYDLTLGEGADALHVKLMRTRHIPSASPSWDDAFFSVGLLVDDRVLISGDTMFDRDLVQEFGADAEAIFHDCQESRGGVHASYGELVTLPDDLRAKTTLYHLPRGITERFEPANDGFAGWAKNFLMGSYVFK
jgi:ribonuclease BN (tRNA processing enzyme)